MVQASPDGTYPLAAAAISAGHAACGAVADSQPCFRFELAIALNRPDVEPTYFLETVPPASAGGVAYGPHECSFMPKTGYATCDAVLHQWIAGGGTDVFGDPTTDERVEVSSDGSHRRAQWFRGGRLEIVPSTSGPATVRVNDLGRDWLTLTGLARGTPGGSGTGCTTPPGATFSVCPPFVGPWTLRGGVAGPGLPLSAPFVGTSDNGDFLMQVFEQARLEVQTSGAVPVFGPLGDAVKRLRSPVVSVPTSTGGWDGIEETEVTRREYDAWLLRLDRGAPKPTPSLGCQSVTDYHADSNCMAGRQVNAKCDAVSCPQVCVNWCAAAAYCAGMGRHLCGRIGGGSLSASDQGVATASEWLNACTAGGQYAYPYGSSVSRAGICQDGNNADGTTPAGNTLPPGPVASRSECQSADARYRGVFDLSGNVWEWDDSCDDTSDSAVCYARGGAAASPGYGRCSDLLPNSRLTAWDSVGFRCCGP